MARRLQAWGRIGPSTAYELVDQNQEALSEALRRGQGLFDPGQFRVRNQDLLAYCEEAAGSRPDLVVAHAVLDLFDPGTASQALARLQGGRYWLTHLFDGFTAWEPVIDPDLDWAVVEAYHRSMDERSPGLGDGSARSGRDWLAALPRAGFRIVDVGASDWVVRPGASSGGPTFLLSLLHFFRESLSNRPDVDQAGLAWWLRVRQGQVLRDEATFVAHQLDVAADLEAR